MSIGKSKFETAVIAMVAATMIPMLTGCGFSGSTSRAVAPLPQAGVALQGKVHGGQQPVSGATIQLYAAGASGYGSAATPLIGATVKTDAGGNFTISSTYACPSAATNVYITSTGGNPGLAAANANIVLMAALGRCGTLSASTFISINEVTTVGAAWALSPFMTGPANLGTSAANIAGLNDAFDNAALLVNTSNGTSPGAAASGVTVPSAELNTLANIMAACVNSTGGVAGDSTACGKFFSAANPGTAPTDTVTAALNIAQNPALNVHTLYQQATAIAPFQPTLPSEPNDFTVAVTFAGGLNAPTAMAADAAGNLWVTNGGNNTLAELSSTGVLLSGAGYTNSLSAPSSVAVATDGTVWVTNKGTNTVSRFTVSGAAYAAPYAGGSLSSPTAVAFDGFGTAWVANSGNSSVTAIDSTGGTLTNYAPSGTSLPAAILLNPH